MSVRSRWLALAVLCGGQLMVILDQTIVNVALSVIQDDLGFSPTGLAWVVNSYLIAFAGLLLLAGRLGDLFGPVRVLVVGLVVFTLASLVCGLAESQWLLIAARFVQGIGGALASAVVLGMIVTMFSTPRERATAIGFFSFVAAAGGALGPLAGGVLTAALSWHWIFFVNVPIGLVAIVLSVRVLPRTAVAATGRADLLGAALVTAGLMLGVAAIVGASGPFWRTVLGGVAVVLLVAFVLRQRVAPVPLLPLRLFAARTLTLANAVQMLMIAAMFGFLFLSPLYLQKVLGFGVSGTGLALLPAPLIIAVVTLLVSARVNHRFGERPVLLAGLGLIVAGFLVLTRLPVDGRYAVDLLPAIVLLATGFGLAMPALTALAMIDAAPEDAGLASGVFNTGQQVGGALGLAVLASVAAARSAHLDTAHLDTPAALTGGYHLAFLLAAGAAAIALALAAAIRVRVPSDTPVTA